MTRRIPRKIAPSPAGAEPGVQNALSRIASSEAVQERLAREHAARLERDAQFESWPEGVNPNAVLGQGTEPPDGVAQDKDQTVEAEPVLAGGETYTSNDDHPSSPDIQGDKEAPAPEAGKPKTRSPRSRPTPSAKSEYFNVTINVTAHEAALIKEAAAAHSVEQEYYVKGLVTVARKTIQEARGQASKLRSFSDRAARIAAAKRGEMVSIGVFRVTTPIKDDWHALVGDPLKVYNRTRVVGAVVSAIIVERLTKKPL